MGAGKSTPSSHYEELKKDVLGKLLDGSFQKIYVGAWKGVGATALPREAAEAVETSEWREFDTVIKVVRPAPFRNRREMQRAVAEQLLNLLPPSVTAALDAADEDDDFSGVELSARDLLSEVRKEISRAVRGRSVLLVLCDDLADAKLVDPKDLGIPIGTWHRNAILWTSGTKATDKVDESLTYIISISPRNETDALDLVYKEAVGIARYVDESSGGSLRTTPQVVLRCFWYGLLLCRAFGRDDWPWEAAVKYFVCDEILQGDAAWEIGKALAPLIGPIVKKQLSYWQKTFSAWTPEGKEKEFLPPKTLLLDSITQKDWAKSSSEETPSEEEPSSEEEPPSKEESSSEEPSSEEEPPSKEEEESYRWISICSPQNKNLEPWDFFFKVYHNSIMSDVSSFFGHFEQTPKALPDSFFGYFSNVRVLDLLGCVVKPINSSFLRLHNLRMLRLERCKVTSLDPNSHPSEREGRRQPTLFDNLLVLNLYNSDADAFLLAGKAFELMPNLLELDLKEEIFVLNLVALNELQERMHKLQVLKLSGSTNTKFLLSLSVGISLKEVILTNCKGLEYLNFNLPATIETISLQRCASLKEVELVDPAAAPFPNLKTFHLSGSKLIAKLSLQGCRMLENVDLQKLMGLEMLDLSCTAIKVVDIRKLPQLKQLFLLGCEQLYRVAGLDKGPELDVLYLDNYNSGSTCDVNRCLDSFRNQRVSELTKGTDDADQRLFHAHVVVRDVRLFRSLHHAFPFPSRAKSCFHIHVKGSSTIKRGISIDTTTGSNATITSASCYADFLNTMTDRHRPSPSTMHLNNHIVVDGGQDSQLATENNFKRILNFANSLFIHDNTSNFTIKNIEFRFLKCLRVERCPEMKFIFSWFDKPDSLESIWLSQLWGLKALHEQGRRIGIGQLKHIYLEFCTSLEYVLPSQSELHNLETINIRHCNDLTAIFKYDDDNEDKRGVAPKLLPKLRSIHLEELPKLRHIYEPNICAPSLEELKIRGCLNLRKLPLLGRSDDRSIRPVKISCEKDWWDKLQWDGLESDRRSSLFNPKHCTYYKKPMKATYL